MCRRRCYHARLSLHFEYMQIAQSRHTFFVGISNISRSKFDKPLADAISGSFLDIQNVIHHAHEGILECSYARASVSAQTAASFSPISWPWRDARTIYVQFVQRDPVLLVRGTACLRLIKDGRQYLADASREHFKRLWSVICCDVAFAGRTGSHVVEVGLVAVAGGWNAVTRLSRYRV